jgi:hypothetical protein
MAIFLRIFIQYSQASMRRMRTTSKMGINTKSLPSVFGTFVLPQLFSFAGPALLPIFVISHVTFSFKKKLSRSQIPDGNLQTGYEF